MGTSPDQLRADIDATRDRLSADANRLADRARPRQMVRRRTDRVRGKVTSLRERVMGSASDTAQSIAGNARSAADSLQEGAGQATGTALDAAQQAGEAVRQAPNRPYDRPRASAGRRPDRLRHRRAGLLPPAGLAERTAGRRWPDGTGPRGPRAGEAGRDRVRAEPEGRRPRGSTERGGGSEGHRWPGRPRHSERSPRSGRHRRRPGPRLRPAHRRPKPATVMLVSPAQAAAAPSPGVPTAGRLRDPSGPGSTAQGRSRRVPGAPRQVSPRPGHRAPGGAADFRWLARPRPPRHRRNQTRRL